MATNAMNTNERRLDCPCQTIASQPFGFFKSTPASLNIKSQRAVHKRFEIDPILSTARQIFLYRFFIYLYLTLEPSHFILYRLVAGSCAKFFNMNGLR